MDESKLAIHGGPPIRSKPLPYRKLFGKKELEAVTKVFEDSWREGVDFGFQGKYEKLYTDKFCEFQGGGFADGVSSGTAAVYLALKVLYLEPGSDVITSPVTNPGSISSIILQGMNIVVADSQPNTFLLGPDEFEAALTPNTRAAVLTHSGGYPIDMNPIVEIAESKGIKIIEDGSQAHGALYKGKRVGRFGDIAAFSTMFSKTLATGGCGGLVYTENEEYYWPIRSHADRGKPFHISDFSQRRFDEYLFPALNFNLDELSCAIGLSTLSRLQKTIDKRFEITRKIDEALDASSVVSPALKPQYDCKPSIFFHTVMVDVDKLKVSKKEFAEAVAAEGIWVNPDYREVVSEWKWLQSYLKRGTHTPNASDFRDRTFNILLNERFSDEDIEDVIASILKVESVLAKT
ncbi:MAG: DegT/DnrJ/EryC1/StrS family aminotransferase [Methanocellales archaeon]|nr:DegT/DnrJ/EryC1/StrS family aminotransferase [Methanocellales archaeon]MDD4897809.1 DegT/DnrJ/EryC1/StrS family aminotransferase [Methanocellales archaeon]MDD5446410.1 DegT/DnrJ/EryC1/StrS family aminotransferase [Methanocellales archaeon]